VDQIKDVEDVVSFHSYWGNINQEIVDVSNFSKDAKPILVEEFGWPTHPSPKYSESLQLNFYTTQMAAIKAHNIAGCVQWMTFDAKDYNTNPNESDEEYFGLWRYDYTLKPAGEYYKAQ